MLENPDIVMNAMDVAGSQRIRGQAENDAIRKKRSGAEFRNKDRRQFCMSNAEGWGRYDAISLADIGALFNLTQYLVTNKGGLLIAKVERKKTDIERYAPEIPLTVKDIQKALGTGGKLRSRKATYKTIAELEKIGALCRDSTARPTLFYIEEDVIKAGDGDFKNFVKIYRVESKKLLDRLSHREAGALFKLMRYAHKDTLVLCENPQEFNPKLVKPLNGRELSEILGVAYQTFRHIMTKLMQAGAMLSVSSVYTDVAGRNYIINPRVCNRGVPNNPYEAGITKLFDQITAKLDKK
ncbi:hypothetical protein OCF62_11855 [Bacillus wiedmannii]|uniref:hypothetical protein n=1 Tax=Bacillus wiedmannii TaxID=1890302 RepID=UPI001155BEF2|nr:hypothetical protein [Bacillus wiedmannii]MCU5515268.1 hypothetical protein [Bacillus wiedmannii]